MNAYDVWALVCVFAGLAAFGSLVHAIIQDVRWRRARRDLEREVDRFMGDRIE